MTVIHEHVLANGLRLVAEPIRSARSLAMSLLLPAGVVHEPEDQLGVIAVLSEMIFRGAGELDARAHSDALDQLGVQRHSHPEMNHLRLGATMIGERFDDAFPLLMDMVRRPTLADAALEPARDLALQALDAMQDEPQQRVFVELRKKHFPAPFGRSSLGERQSIQELTAEAVREFHHRCFVPQGAILGFAGQFDWDRLVAAVERQLADWSGEQSATVDEVAPQRGYTHETAESTQVHIGVAFEAVPETDERSVLQKAAVAVLSGGMSGRLFTEVREKRGLCYSVGARYGGDRRFGIVLSYAGTTAPRAQETYDVLTGELRRISEGIEAGEFARALVGMKSSLVMQGESTGARASAIVADQYVYGRPRSLDELARLVDSVTLDRLNEFVAASPAGEMTVVTIGPDAMKVDAETSTVS